MSRGNTWYDACRSKYENCLYNHTAHPPETGRAIPVIKEASSEARNAITFATSSGSAIHPKGVLAIIVFLCLSAIDVSRVGVLVSPGSTALTVTPSWPHSFATLFVNPMIPALAVE